MLSNVSQIDRLNEIKLHTTLLVIYNFIYFNLYVANVLCLSPFMLFFLFIDELLNGSDM